MAVKSFKNFLVEKLIDVDKRDIDLIYKPYSEFVRDASKAFSQRKLSKSLRELWLKYAHLGDLQKFNSSQFVSPAAKAAHEINPIKIICVFRGGNHYVPSQKFIQIGINPSAFQALYQYDTLNSSERRRLPTEFTELKLRSTIRHEINHWLDDSLHNLHMSKISQLNDPERFAKYVKQGNLNVNLGSVEIEAIVHTVAEIQRHLNNQSKWDTMSFQNLVDLHPSLIFLNELLGEPWRRKVKTRMAREGLLGKKMR